MSDRLCKQCGIKLTGTMLLTHTKCLLCKYCYKDYQAEQFKFYYEKTKKLKPKVIKTCNVCESLFTTARDIKNTCSPKCRAEWKRRVNNIRIKNEKRN